jgi:hypothetical protein
VVETNCRIDPVPLVVTLTNAGAIWFQGVLARCDELDVTRKGYERPAFQCPGGRSATSPMS